MKKPILFVALLLFLSINALAQPKSQPAFLKGKFKTSEQNMQAVIVANAKYPVNALLNYDQGIVKLTFIISENGKVTDIKVLNPGKPDIEKEAIRLVGLLRGWRPALNNGIAVKEKKDVAIEFLLKKITANDTVGEINLLNKNGYRLYLPANN